MEALIEYAIIGLIAIAFLFLLSPTLIEFYGSAVTAVNDSSALTSSESSIITAVLLLMLLVFFLFGLWIMYKEVQNRV